MFQVFALRGLFQTIPVAFLSSCQVSEMLSASHPELLVLLDSLHSMALCLKRYLPVTLLVVL